MGMDHEWNMFLSCSRLLLCITLPFGRSYCKCIGQPARQTDGQTEGPTAQGNRYTVLRFSCIDGKLTRPCGAILHLPRFMRFINECAYFDVTLTISPLCSLLGIHVASIPLSEPDIIHECSAFVWRLGLLHTIRIQPTSSLSIYMYGMWPR